MATDIFETPVHSDVGAMTGNDFTHQARLHLSPISMAFGNITEKIGTLLRTISGQQSETQHYCATSARILNVFAKILMYCTYMFAFDVNTRG